VQKRYDDFTSELAVDGMDPNQPDSKGRLPLMEAVRSKDIRFVDALIQFGAVANSKDPATGSAPIQLAFQSAQADVSFGCLGGMFVPTASTMFNQPSLLTCSADRSLAPGVWC
jgi:ankyrin repeat protein